MLTRALIPYGILIAAVLALTGFAYRSGAAAARAKADVEIRAVGLELLNERARNAETVVLLEDSIRRVVAREAEQREILTLERDAYAREVEFQRKVSTSYIVELASLRDSAESVVTIDSADVRRAEFHVEQPPYTVDARVEMPAPPAPARLWVGVSMLPIPMRSITNCGVAEPPHGLRPVISEIEMPWYVRAEIQEAVADPGVCNPLPHRITGFDRHRIGAPYAIAGVAIGAIGALILIH